MIATDEPESLATENPGESKNRVNNAIVLMVDGLNPTLLSPMGCSWTSTPNMDQLAAESIVLESALTETIDPAMACHSWLSGRHPVLCSNTDGQHDSTICLESLRQSGIHTCLLTDDPAWFPDANRFDQVVAIDQDADDNFSHALDLADTRIAGCIATAIREIPKLASPFFCLVHLTSLNRIWDAPIDFRKRFRDDADPEEYQGTLVPCQSGQFDPDQILVWTHAYAGQIEAFDSCLGILIQELRLDGLLENTIFQLVGLRGFPLGYHNQIGHHIDHLYAESTRIPVFIKPPECFNSFSAGRSNRLTTLSGCYAPVGDWLINGTFDWCWPEKTFDSTQSNQLAIITGHQANAIATPGWLLIQDGHDLRLFVKPDDRFDVNPVQDRCRWVSSELQDMLSQARKQLAAGKPLLFPPLADELLHGP